MKFATRIAAGIVLAASLSGQAAKPPTDKTVSIPVVLTPAQQMKVKAIRSDYRTKYAELAAKRREMQAAEAKAIAEAVRPAAVVSK